MSYDPVVTAIAVATNDALTEHVWRFDTATDGASGDPVADVAAALAGAARDFTATSQVLARILTHLHERCGHHLRSLADFATLIRPFTLDVDLPRLVQQLERFDSQRDTLLSMYAVWRRHRPVSREPGVRHLLPQPHNPRWGMLTLRAGDTGMEWLAVADDTAAKAFQLRHRYGLLGAITSCESGWQGTAFTNPEHRLTCPHLVYQLPAVDDEATACRTLLRWWALRESDTWQGRTPADLTAAEQAGLTA